MDGVIVSSFFGRAVWWCMGVNFFFGFFFSLVEERR